MLDMSDDENDSRTASVGRQRLATGLSATSRQSLQEENIGGRKDSLAGCKDVCDLVPQSGMFGTSALPIDLDSTSRSGSSIPSASENELELESDNANPLTTAQLLNGIPETVNGNQGSRSTISTPPSKTVFIDLAGSSSKDTIGEPDRSRSTSVSRVNHVDSPRESSLEGPNQIFASFGANPERNTPKLAAKESYFVDETDDSELGEISDDSNSILLNLSSHNETSKVIVINATSPLPGLTQGAKLESRTTSEPIDERETSKARSMDYIGERNINVHRKMGKSKEDAFHAFSRKYSTAPSTLAELDADDLAIQTQYFFYNCDIHDIDLKLPISCTECLQEGHLAIVCPLKECEHCHVWNVHESRFCPLWRRCQKCRERGHDARGCASALKGTASEVPCDFCGSEDHVERDCDLMWKLPKRNMSPGPILVSVSCSHCTSNRHLIGDCPQYRKPVGSSTWSLKHYDSAMITNVNTVLRDNGNGLPLNEVKGGQRDRRSPSPDSDDVFDNQGRRNPVNKSRGHPTIRFGSGIGRNRNLSAPQDPRKNGIDSRQTYRDRQDFSASHTRRRSMSPSLRSVKTNDTRAKASWQPAPRSPLHGRSRIPPPRHGRGGNANSDSRGGGHAGTFKRGPTGDSYRPMPIVGKKARDKFRL